MKISDAKILLKGLLRYNLDQAAAQAKNSTFLVPYFVGDPGLGKTAFIKQVAEEEDVPYHQTIIAQYDAGELGGFGIPTDVIFENEDGTRYTEKRVIRARPDYLPDPRSPDGVVGIYNLDEIAQAFLANMNICSQMVNEWRVGEHPISPGITIVATGNRPENKAGTTTMPSHLKDRFMFIFIEADHGDFMVYAAQRGLHRWVRAFIQKNPAYLHKFEVGVNASPSPRSWEKTSIVLGLGLPSHIQTEALYGQIGEGMATQFLAYIKVEDRMPDVFELIKNPEQAPVFESRDADILYMLIANLVDVTTDKNIEPVIKYLKRLPNKEFVAMWAKDVLLRHPNLNNNKHMTDFKLTELTKILI